MDEEFTYRAVHPRYTAAFIIQNNRVVRAAPILARKILFLPADAAIKVLVNSGARIEPVTGELPGGTLPDSPHSR